MKEKEWLDLLEYELDWVENAIVGGYRNTCLFSLQKAKEIINLLKSELK